MSSVKTTESTKYVVQPDHETREQMTKPDHCTLMGCNGPRVTHHHHFIYGHLNIHACNCSSGGYPGYGEN